MGCHGSTTVLQTPEPTRNAVRVCRAAAHDTETARVLPVRRHGVHGAGERGGGVPGGVRPPPAASSHAPLARAIAHARASRFPSCYLGRKHQRYVHSHRMSSRHCVERDEEILNSSQSGTLSWVCGELTSRVISMFISAEDSPIRCCETLRTFVASDPRYHAASAPAPVAP